MKYLYTFHQSSVFYRPCADCVMIGLLSSIHVTFSAILFHRLLYIVDCIIVYMYIILLISCVDFSIIHQNFYILKDLFHSIILNE